MTVSAQVAPVTTSMVLAVVDEASSAKYRYRDGVIGLVGQPDPAGRQDLERDGTVVRIRPAESALAAREALLEHRPGDWMVILTDRADEDLGPGILSHFIWGMLRRPDPWEAVRHRFRATGIDPALTTPPGNRDLALALLAATPTDGWPAAPAGVLTRAHVMRSVARATLRVVSETIDLLSVSAWSVLPSAVRDLSEFRAHHGDRLADAVLDWLAESCGVAAAPIRTLLQRGHLGDVVPLGLVAQLLTDDAAYTESERHDAQLALVRLEPLIGVQPRSVLMGWGAATTAVVVDLANDPRQAAHLTRVLARTESLLDQVMAAPLAARSDLLPRGFRGRLLALGEALRDGCSRLAGDREGARASSAAVERAWALVKEHRLGGEESPETHAFAAAVRLWRWMLTDEASAEESLAARAQRHLSVDSWADAAVNDAAIGVDDAPLSASLRQVVEATLARRDREERAFAAALAAYTATDAGDPTKPLTGGDAVWPLESLLPHAVIPMAKRAPVLLLVMDGMSAATANEILHDAVGRLGWVEASMPGGGLERTPALAVLPSLTSVSRASLLCGRLVRGEQSTETSGYRQLTQNSAKIAAALFHKKGVDTTTPGALVNDGVGAAIDDADLRLVTVVLNTIDDALDRSDPSGTVWTADAVKHLAPLLARARAAGRTVVMTADHGHVVERRRSVVRSSPGATSNRWRPAGGPVALDEIAVKGRRVLADSEVVLAVSEGLRYGPLKAGYHGGASAAEVVVPVAVLLPDVETNPLGLTLLPPQTPPWWELPVPAATEPPAPAPSPAAPLALPPSQTPTLFDDLAVAEPAQDVAATQRLGEAVVATETFRAQRAIAGRLIVADPQVMTLITRLADAPSSRMPLSSAASALGVSEVRVRGALVQVQQLLNVEGYPVVELDPETRSVLLNERLLREQFEVADGG